MDKDSMNNGFVVQEAPQGMVVTEEMGLTPQEACPSGDQSEDAEIPMASEVLDEQELKGILESLLYVSHEPITLEKFVAIFGGYPKGVIHNALLALQRDYDQEGRGLRIAELAGGFVMVTRPDCASWIARLHKVKAAPKVSRSALETLAIIAYRQPIVRAEIEQIRGVESAGVIRTLLDQKLLRIVGRKDVPGRPMMYGTTKVFLQRFGLRDLRDLPPLREFKELGEGMQPDMFGTKVTGEGEDAEITYSESKETEGSESVTDEASVMD